jgi:hypothetical protein
MEISMQSFSRAATLAVLALAATQLSLHAAKADGPTTFTVVIRNVATKDTLKLPDGKATTAPIAPGVYAVLEASAELFASHQPARSDLESLGEDGDGQALLDVVGKMTSVVHAEMFVPGQPFTVRAEPGQRLVFATMFAQSNDKYYAPLSVGVELFDGHNPVAGDLTGKVMLWDAGTEKDEPPEAGPNQAPRQTHANQGPAEDRNVRPADDGFTYPTVSEVIQFTVLPQSGSNSPS